MDAHTHNMQGRTGIHTETSTSGINGLEAALSRWEEVRALSEQKPYKAPSVNTLKLFLLFPKKLFISEGIALTRCVFTSVCIYVRLHAVCAHAFA